MKKEEEVSVNIGMQYINNGIFPGGVLLCHGMEYDEIIGDLCQQEMEEWYTAISQDQELIETGNWMALYRTYSGKHFYFIILKEPFNFTDYDYCKLAHEVLHICQFFLPDVLERDREIEAEAYYHTYLMQECLKFIRNSSTEEES